MATPTAPATLPQRLQRPVTVYPSLARRRKLGHHTYGEWLAPIIARLHTLPRGVSAERLAHRSSNRERVFALMWESENDSRPYHRGGWYRTTLRALLTPTPQSGRASQRWPSGANRRYAPVSNRDQRVAATVAQWLGSNVGFGWLEECLRACGYGLVRLPDGPVPLPCPSTDDTTGRPPGGPPARPHDVRRRAARHTPTYRHRQLRHRRRLARRTH